MKNNILFNYKKYVFPLSNKGWIVISVFIFSSYFLSCESDVVVDYKEGGGNIVIFSFPASDSVLKIHTSYSVGSSSLDDYDRMYDGTVRVIKNDVLVDSFTWNYRNVWAERKNISINEGDNFEIEVSNSKTRAYASTTIPYANKIISVKLDTANISSSQENINCKFRFNNNIEVDNFYQLVITEEIETITDGKKSSSTRVVNYKKDDKVFYIRDQQGSLLGGIDFEGAFSDYLIETNPYTLNIRINKAYVRKAKDNEKRILNFHLLTLSKDYYDYLRSRIIAEYNDQLPIVTPIKIHNNVNNGLGLVGGLSNDVYSITFIGKNYNE